MTARRVAIAAVVCLTLIASAGGASERFLSAGGNEMLWLVRCDDVVGNFDIVVRPIGQQWKWATKEKLGGTPVHAVATRGRLHLLLDDPPAYFRFNLTRGKLSPGQNPVDARWPARTVPLAVCDGGGAEGAELLAVVATATSESPAPDAGSGQANAESVNLAVFANAGVDWSYLTELENVRLAKDTKVLAAAVEGRLYVFIWGEGGNRLWEWTGGKWRDVPLQGAAADQRPIAMLPVGGGGGKLVIFFASADEGELHSVSVVTVKGSGVELPGQPITLDGQGTTWRRQSPLLIVKLGERFAFIWPEESGVRFATCGLDGRLDPPKDIGVFTTPPADTRGGAISQYFTLAIMALVLVVSVLTRAKEPPRSFMLPEGIRPANLAKRAAAGIIDLLPFLVLGQIIFPPLIPIEQLESASTAEIWKLVQQHHMSASGAYAMIVAYTSHLVYCVAMEVRFAATLGKMAMHLHVVANGGVRVGLREVVLRNLVKIFVLASLPLLMFIVLLNRNRQRLGDLLARTSVVESSPLRPPLPSGSESAGDDDTSGATDGD